MMNDGNKNHGSYEISYAINGIRYFINKDEKTASVYECDNSNIDIYIPRSIKYESIEYPVTSILPNAFYQMKSIKIQFAPDSQIQSIDTEAFCFSSIESISFPSSLIKLQPNWYNSSIKKISISPNNPYYSLYENTFILKKSSLEKENFDVLIFVTNKSIEKAVIPSYIEIIESCAFEFCCNLRKIEISDDSKLRIINEDAFSFSKIDSLYIPASLVELKKGWCNKIENLSHIKISSNNQRYIYLNETYILEKSDQNSDIYDTIVFARRDIQTAVIPSFIKIIGPYAFNSCKSLTKVEYSSNCKLEIIDEFAFSDIQIESIKIPASVTTIKKGAFCTCENLKDIEIPEDSNLLSICDIAFMDSSIESLLLPSKLQALEDRWCHFTINLTNIFLMKDNQFFSTHYEFIIGKSNATQDNFDTLLFAVRDIENAIIPSFIEIIKASAFNECDKLYSIEFEDDSKLRVIEEDAFSYSAIINIDLPKHLKQIGYQAFRQCEFLENIYFPHDSELQIIDELAFKESTINSIFIPPHVTLIKEGAFLNCAELQFVDIPTNSELQVIDDYSFQCTAIECISVPGSIKKLGFGAFRYCKQLCILEIDEKSNLEIFSKNIVEGSLNVLVMIPSKIIISNN